MSTHTVPTEALHAWVRELFEALGSSADEARLTADHLVGANLAGHDSHGVGMVPLYVESCLAGFLTLNREIDVVVDTGSMLVVDGGTGMGQSVAHQAMTLAVERAREHGIALLGLRNAHHIGRVGHWAEMATEAGLVGIHFTNAMAATPVVAPYGGAEARFLTNPFTVGIPRAEGEPILLDFATSAIAHGKARVAMNSGLAVPEGTVIDAEGKATSDPRVLFEAPTGALRTFAAHKGHALAMVCELLGAALTGGVTGRPKHLPKAPGVINNMLAILFDPARLGTGASFEREASAFIDWVRSARLDDVGEALGGILMPGEPEQRSRAARATHVPIDAGTLAELAAAARQVNERARAARDSTSGRHGDARHVPDPRELPGVRAEKTGHCRAVTPMVPVGDLERAIDFYRDVLGFEAIVVMPDRYAYLRRDATALRLLKAGPGVDTASRAMQLSCYVDVDDVDALWAELAPRLATLADGRVRSPFDRDYGQREFHVIDEDGMLIFFGAPITETDTGPDIPATS